MNFRQLEIFVAVVECGQVTRAAEKLFIAQPSVSLAVSELEKRYGVTLFDRLGKRLHLTQVGEELYQRAKQTLKGISEMQDLLDGHCTRSWARIGATMTIGTCILPELISSLPKDGSLTIKKIMVDNTEKILEAILSASLDFGLIEGECHHPSITAQRVCRDTIAMVASSSYQPQNIIPNFLAREVGSGTRVLAMEKLLKSNFKVENVWEVGSTEAIKNLLRNGDSVTAISTRLVKKEIESGEFKIIPGLSFERNFYFAFHKDRVLSPALLDLKKKFEDFTSMR